jgi:hypothetical protein
MTDFNIGRNAGPLPAVDFGFLDLSCSVCGVQPILAAIRSNSRPCPSRRIRQLGGQGRTTHCRNHHRSIIPQAPRRATTGVNSMMIAKILLARRDAGSVSANVRA